MELEPDSAAAHVLTGEALDGLGKTSEAIAEFETAVKISPREPNLHFGLGYLLWKSQQYDRARQEFEAELSLDPNHAQALAYLGDIEWKNNQPDAALSLFKRAIQGNHDLRIVYVDLGALYMQQKNYKEAQAALLRAVASKSPPARCPLPVGTLVSGNWATQPPRRKNLERCESFTKIARRASWEKCPPLNLLESARTQVRSQPARGSQLIDALAGCSAIYLEPPER